MNTDGASGQALLTDLYQLTMAYGYWRHQMYDRRAAFHLFFRSCPFGGQYTITAGLGPAVDWLTRFRVEKQDVDYLRTIAGNDGQPLFPNDFLSAIEGMTLDIDIDAMAEGTLAFAHEPILRVIGPLWQCQWIETALLNMINFQTLIATKAARVCDAADGDDVLEFGLRRAQGIDGALSASRAAYIGGCQATSNVQAGQRMGIPVRGTHAHSWVMSFDDEFESFQAYAEAMPNNCVFLVDTYDTIEGVKNAIRAGVRLRQSGHQMVGIRLDSGDLAALSIAARKMLDEAGFHDTKIVGSNDLDEHEITRLKRLGAKISVWGVGTRLVTARDQPALGGVYKLGALQDERGDWDPRIKLSEIPVKISTPGIQQVRRYSDDKHVVGDAVYSELIGPPATANSVRSNDPASSDPASSLLASSLLALPVRHEDLLQPVLRGGSLVQTMPSLQQIRQHACTQREQLPPSLRKLEGVVPYPVELEPRLAMQKQRLVDSIERL